MSFKKLLQNVYRGQRGSVVKKKKLVKLIFTGLGSGLKTRKKYRNLDLQDEVLGIHFTTV